MIAWTTCVAQTVNGVDLKRVPPKSRPTAAKPEIALQPGPRSAGTPPSTFLFLPIHLSNSPGPGWPHPPDARREPKPFCLRPGSEPATGHSDGASEARHRAERRRAVSAVYRLPPVALSTPRFTKSIHSCLDLPRIPSSTSVNTRCRGLRRCPTPATFLGRS